jgi:hypothetical protein
MTNSFKLAKPSTRVIKFFDRYRHRSCSKASRFSIVSNPLLSNQIALHAVYGDRLSIFLNPRKCKKSLSFKMGFSYPWFSKHDSLTSAADISGKPPAFSFDSASKRLRSFSKKYVLSLSYLSMLFEGAWRGGTSRQHRPCFLMLARFFQKEPLREVPSRSDSPLQSLATAFRRDDGDELGVRVRQARCQDAVRQVQAAALLRA